MQPQSPGPQVVSPPDVPSSELVREAIDEAKQLIRLEVELAKDEVRREVVATKSAGIALAAGAAGLILGGALLLGALALAIFPGPIPSLFLGLILIAAALLAGVVGFGLLPKKPLAETRRRLGTGIDVVKEGGR